MLGHYITGFRSGIHWATVSMLIALCLAAGYALLGACWIVFKTAGELQQRAGLGAARAVVHGPGHRGGVAGQRRWRARAFFASGSTFRGAVGIAHPGVEPDRVRADLAHAGRDGARPSAAAWTPVRGAVALFVLAFAGLATACIRTCWSIA